MATIEYDKDRHTWVCPDCGEEVERVHPVARCNCKDPIWMVIQPGQHIHRKCPVHGDQKIYGPTRVWLRSIKERRGYE